MEVNLFGLEKLQCSSITESVDNEQARVQRVAGAGKAGQEERARIDYSPSCVHGDGTRPI